MFKIFLAAIIAVIFFISTGNVCSAKSEWQPEITIGILSGVNEVTLQFTLPCIMRDVNTKKQIKKIPHSQAITIKASDIQTSGIDFLPEKADLKHQHVMINGKDYFGSAKILKRGSTITVINVAPVEEYLRGVLPKEMIQSWHIEALKAQAVAARTFVLKNRNKHKNDGYELCATTHCQVYNGVETFNTTDRAVTETRGEVLYQGGRTVDAPFHADSGGMTESAENVWGGKVEHLQPISEEFSHSQAWTVKFSVYDFSSRMGDAFGNLKNFNLSPLTIGKSSNDRSTSGRVKILKIIGTKKIVEMKGDEARRKFSLPSTLFDVKIENGEVIFNGYGKGHGVGLSQYGAKFYAEKGWTYDKILAHYYKGATLKKLY